MAVEMKPTGKIGARSKAYVNAMIIELRRVYIRVKC